MNDNQHDDADVRYSPHNVDEAGGPLRLAGWKALLWVLAVIPLVFTAVLLPMTPSMVPAHYGLAGQVERWGSRYENFIIPLFCLVFAVVWMIMGRCVVRRSKGSAKDRAATLRTFMIGGAAALVIFNAINAFILWTSISSVSNLKTVGFPMLQILLAVLGLMLLVTGNFLPQAKPNTFTGVRVHGAYASRETWRRCQRVGGLTFVVAGIVLIVAGIFVRNNGLGLAVLVVVALLLCVIPLAYAPYAARKYGNIGGPILDEHGDFIGEE